MISNEPLSVQHDFSTDILRLSLGEIISRFRRVATMAPGRRARLRSGNRSAPIRCREQRGGLPDRAASPAATRESTRCRPCWLRVAATVNSRSANRVPAPLSPPKLLFRHSTGILRSRASGSGISSLPLLCRLAARGAIPRRKPLRGKVNAYHRSRSCPLWVEELRPRRLPRGLVSSRARLYGPLPSCIVSADSPARAGLGVGRWELRTPHCSLSTADCPGVRRHTNFVGAHPQIASSHRTPAPSHPGRGWHRSGPSLPGTR